MSAAVQADPAVCCVPLGKCSSLRFIAEADNTLKRRRDARPETLWMESALYPDYYMNTFHYQSDGWMSSASADVYEVRRLSTHGRTDVGTVS